MEKFLTWLDEQAACLREESQKLAADDRRDEGNFAKIRANIYGICKSVFQVQGAERALDIMNRLRGEWETSLSAAREHNDMKKAAIEEIKLETLAEIQAKREEV